MMRDTDFVGKKDCVLFFDIAAGYDAVIIRNEMDALLATCTIETDIAIRKTLVNDGYPAAMEVLHLASETQKGGHIFEWIEKKCQQKNNPVKLGYQSPGITVDFGLHDHQTRQAMMVSMQICKHVLPTGSKRIRTETYLNHREACIKRLTDEEKEFFLKGQSRMSQSSKEWLVE